MLEKALRLCEAEFGNITTYDDERFSFAAVAGHSEFSEWVRRNGPGEPRPGTTMERTRQQRRRGGGGQANHRPSADQVSTAIAIRKARTGLSKAAAAIDHMAQVGKLHTWLPLVTLTPAM